MELIIEELSYKGYLKLVRAHEDFITEVHWTKENETITVVMGIDSLWDIRKIYKGIEIKNENSDQSVVIKETDFVRIILQ